MVALQKYVAIFETFVPEHSKKDLVYTVSSVVA